MVVLIRSLTPVKFHHSLIVVESAIITVWLLVALFVTAFQCSFPHPRTLINNTCVRHTEFWAFVDVVKILSDIPLVVLPIVIVGTLQLRAKSKIAIVGVFLGRLL